MIKQDNRKYAIVRYYKSSRGPAVIGHVEGIDRARAEVMKYKSTSNSFVGFTLASNL